MRLSRFFLWALVAAFVGTIAVPIAVFYSPLRMSNPTLLAGAGMYLVLYLVLAFGCAIVAERGHAPILMRSAMVAGALGAAAFMAMLFAPASRAEDAWMKLGIWPAMWACLVLVVGLLLLPDPPARLWIWLRRVTIAMLVLLAAVLCLGITFEPQYSWPLNQTFDDAEWERIRRYDEMLARTMAAGGLLAGAGVVFTFLLAFLPRLTGGVTRRIDRRSYWLQCPRCAAGQDARTGEHHCLQCGLRVRVELR